MSDKDFMRTPGRYIAWVLFCAVTAATRAQTAPSPTPAPPAAGAGIAGSRVLRTFDFEETKLGNFEATPMYWSKVVGRGYPAYSTGQFDHGVFRSSSTSFKMQTEGGSVAYRYAPPPDKIIPIQANTDYYILAFVRSSQLKHARADLTAWFADEQGNLILPTETHSQPYTPADAPGAGGDTWQVLYIFLPGPEAGAMGSGPGKPRQLVLQMGLSQPQQLENTGDDGLGKFAIYQQDIQGAVWFDDVTVLQLPRVGVATHHATDATAQATVFGPGEPVALDMQLSDLTQNGRGGAKTLRARMRVTNSDGLVYAQQEWDARPTPQEGWNQRFTHAALPAGMYTATMEVVDANAGAGESGLIARRQTQFLCLPADTRTALPAAKFGLGAASFTDSAQWNELPTLLRQTGAGLIQLPVWRQGIPEESLSRRDPALEALMTRLQRQNVQMIGAFAQVPAFLQSRITPQPGEDPNSVFTLLDAPPESWRPYMSFLLTRYANRLDWWELGDPAAPLSGTLAASNGPTGGGGIARFSFLTAPTAKWAGCSIVPK